MSPAPLISGAAARSASARLLIIWLTSPVAATSFAVATIARNPRRRLPLVAKSSKERRVNPVCPICGSREAIAIDHRPYVPILQNRVWPDGAAARTAPLGELDMKLCTACGFAWNRAFDADAMIYDPEYDNDQMGSPSFGAHVDTMVERVLASVPPDTDTHLVEVGCGEGAFLRKLALTKRF